MVNVKPINLWCLIKVYNNLVIMWIVEFVYFIVNDVRYLRMMIERDVRRQGGTKPGDDRVESLGFIRRNALSMVLDELIQEVLNSTWHEPSQGWNESQR